MFKRLRREQRGAVMVLAATSMTALILFAGLALDFGRVYMLKTRLQSALDAATLAGALEADPMVDFDVARWVEYDDICTVPGTGENYPCVRTRRASNAHFSGVESAMLPSGWRSSGDFTNQCAGSYICTGSPRNLDRWFRLHANASSVATSTFYRNENWPGDTSREGPNVTIAIDRYEPTVKASATLRVPTTFLKLMGLRELRFTKSGAAAPTRR